MDEQRDAINKAADKQIAHLERQATKAIKDLSDPDKNEAIKALRERTIKRLERLNELLEAEKEKAKEQMKRLIEEVINLGILSNRQLRQLNKMAEKMGVDVIPAAASGGYFGRGPVLVGENGPELVNFSNPARIIDNNTTNGLLNGNSDKIAKAIENLKEEIKAVVNTQSAANPIIVDKLTKIDEKLSSVERTARLSA
jgi:exonuclease VII large subunit